MDTQPATDQPDAPTGRVRIAVAQIDSLPPTETDSGAWRLAEPFLSSDPREASDSTVLLETLASQCEQAAGRLRTVMANIEDSYVDLMRSKLREILSFCKARGANLLILPEYSVPVRSLDALLGFPSELAIVAGVGMLRGQDIQYLRELGFDKASELTQRMNAAIVLGKGVKAVVTKRFHADGESIEQGTGPTTFVDLIPGFPELTVGVSICLDFHNAEGQLGHPKPDIVAIPALTRSMKRFVEDPADFLRVFANNAVYGQSYIGAASVLTPSVSNRQGTLPFQPLSEGIAILEWDPKRPTQTVPSSKYPPQHNVVTFTSIVYSGRDRALANSIRPLSDPQMTASDLKLRAKDLLASSPIELAYYPALSHVAREVVDRADRMSTGELDMLRAQLVLSDKILSLSEWRYEQMMRLVDEFDRLRRYDPVRLSSAQAQYEVKARSYAKDVREELVRRSHLGETADDHPTERVLMLASLGVYSQDDATETLPRQLGLLRTIAELSEAHIALRYRFKTVKDETFPGLNAQFEIILSSATTDGDEFESLRESLGQLLGNTFRGAYTFSYSHRNVSSLEESSGEEDVIEIRPEWTHPDHESPVPASDMGVIGDLLRALEQELTLELVCVGAPRSDDGFQPAVTNAELVQAVIQGHRSLRQASRDLSAATMLRDTNAGDPDGRRLAVQLLLRSQQRIPDSLVSAIGVALCGSGKFTWSRDPVRLTATSLAPGQRGGWDFVSPAAALKVLHPPHAEMYGGTPYSSRPLAIPADADALGSTGVVLGSARVMQVRADEMREVRVPEADRLLHTYIIGKTGTGKTNLLKAMASQDVQIADRGVTIIDPHGDLVDYILHQIPLSRLQNVVLVDLSRTDALPVLNPLDIDRTDTITRDRTIQELIALTRSRVFHEYTGPRFEEYVRLALRTMLDPGYPEPASLVELPRLLMNNVLQDRIVALLEDSELRERWKFETTIRQSKDYGDTIHWVTSKFDDLVRDATLRCTLGGARSTVSLDKIVNDGSILLVKIPEAVIGKEAADFIGSLIISQLSAVIVRRKGFTEDNRHFIYVDEFQNFANTDFHVVVAEARKFGIGFTLAHQNLEQLREFRTYTGGTEQRLVSAILGNVANFVVFPIGSTDASALTAQLDVLPADILRLERFSAICRISVDGAQVGPFVLKTNRVPDTANPTGVAEILERMHNDHWRRRGAIIAELDERFKRLSGMTAQPAEKEEAADAFELSELLDRDVSRRSRESGGSRHRALIKRMTDLQLSVREHMKRETPSN